jgi:hypothetical protein
MSTDISIVYLKKFNERFTQLCAYFRTLVPDMKELILVEDAIDFCVHRGNPEIPISLFYKNLIKFKEDIMKEDDRLFEENIIMSELNKALANNKDIIGDKYNNVLTEKETVIRENIQRAKSIWTGLTDGERKKIWTMVQVLLKLSEKYAEKR